MSEEEKAIKWLKEKTEDYSIDSRDLHYLKIIYNLLGKMKEIEEKNNECKRGV